MASLAQRLRGFLKAIRLRGQILVDPAPLDQDAQALVLAARQRAGEAGFEFFSDADLLLAILETPASAAFGLLSTLGIPIAALQDTTTQVLASGSIRPGPRPRPVTAVVPTRNLTAVLQAGAREATQQGCATASSAHLLLGALLTPDTVSWHICTDAGLTPALLRRIQPEPDRSRNAT